MGVMGIVIAIILLGSILVPVVSDAISSTSSEEKENTEYAYLGKFDQAETDFTMEFTSSNHILVNGVEITTASYTLVVWGENFRIAGTASTFNVQFEGGPVKYTPKISVEQGSVYNTNNDGHVLLGTYEYAFIPDNEGDLCVYTSATTAKFIDKNAKIYSFVNKSPYGGSDAFALASYYPDGSSTINGTYLNAEGTERVAFTSDDASISFSDMERVDQLHYKFSAWPRISMAEGDTTLLTNIVIPLTYHEVTSSATASLFGIIPLFVILSILIYAVYIVRGREA